MSDKMDLKQGSLTFDVDAQLIQELGERLVSRNHIGISELIKNAYDADSPTVEVALYNVANEINDESELIISDNGTGMTFKTVERHWMTIGTSNKREHPVSPIFGRPVTGNKGIGRFACQRLAKFLELETCAKTDSGYEHTIVKFEWDDFEPGQSLSKVQCDYKYYRSHKGEIGTKLRLVQLRDRMTERDFKMLLKSITLISVAQQTKRVGYAEDPGFNAMIIAPEFKSIIGENQFVASDKLLSSGWGTITGVVNSKGQAILSLESKDSPKQSYQIKEDKFSALKGIKFTVYIIPMKGRDQIENRRTPSLLTNKNLKAIRDIYSGIKLYLNGFRVYPYGDVLEDDDWLGIARDISRRRGGTDFKELNELASSMGLPSPSRIMLNHPGTRSLIGSVLIDGEATNAFEVKMDREGLVETENFKRLKNLIRMSLDWSTLHYEDFLHRARRKRHEDITKRFESSLKETFEDDESRFKKAIETLDTKSEIKNRTPFSSASIDETNIHLKVNKSELSSQNLANSNEELKIETAKEYAISQYEARNAEVDLLRALSATAPLLFVFAHEVRGISQTLLSHASGLKFLSERLKHDDELKIQLLNMASDAEKYKDSFDNLFKLFDVFSDSTSKGNKKTSYKNLFENVQKAFHFFSEQFKITLDFGFVNPTYQIPKLNQAEAYSVLINLISNSMKSLIASRTKKRIVKVEVERKKEYDLLTVMDNGIGLSKQHWERVFEPKVHDPEGTLYSSIDSKLNNTKLSNLGKGSGLGLNIVRNILKKYKGNATFIESGEDWKATIQVKMER